MVQPSSFTVEHTLTRPATLALEGVTDLFTVHDSAGREIARCYTAENAALIVAALSLCTDRPDHPMRCPACMGEESKVIETRHPATGGVYRRRECSACSARFRTHETVIGLVRPGAEVGNE